LNNPSLKKLHQQYIKDKQKRKRNILITQFLLLLLFLGIWQLASYLQWIDPLLFSSPITIFQLCIEKIQDHSIFHHLYTTVVETSASFILGTLFGLLIAILLWWFPTVAKITDPYLVTLNAMPKIALGPIMIIIFGTGITSAIAMGIIICIIVTIIVIYTAFQEVNQNYVKVLQTFNATKWQIFKEVILPSSLPSIISTLKVNVGLAWVGVIVGEFFVSKSGLGYLIVYGFQVFNFNLVLLSVFIIMIIAVFMYVAVDYFEKVLLKKMQRK